MTTLGLGAAAIVLAVLFHWLGIFTRLRAVLGFIGTCIVAGGLFGSLLTRGVTLVSNLTNTVFGKIFGVVVPGLLVIVLLVIFIHDLHPKGGGASKRTLWVGIALAACLGAGLSSFATLNQLPSSVRTGVSTTIGR